MGYALAHAFIHAGHSVMLISGPTELDVPPHVDFIQIQSAAEMYAAVAHTLARMDIAVFAAAVADYAPASVATRKIKKSGERMTLELIRTPDILGAARQTLGFAGTLVGFAAETDNLEANARDKLVRKDCNLIVANDVSIPGLGFDSDHNHVLLVYPDYNEVLPIASKHVLAHRLVKDILALHERLKS